MRRRNFLRLVAVAVGHAFVAPGSALAKTCGDRFSGQVVEKWLDDGRNMQLAESFEYISSDCRRWPVPKGAVTDGASIPPVFWSVLGGPYEDKYRTAAVIHDYYCDVRTRKYTSVHKVFYEAMQTSHVDSTRAWIMYQAVLRFGPRWPDPPIDDPRCDAVDAKYDFTLCAQNSAKPPVTWPVLDQQRGQAFLDEIKSRASTSDLQALTRAVSKLQ